MSNLVMPPCPTDCASSLGAVSFNECSPELHYGEIRKLYVARADAADFVNSGAIGEWTTRLSDTSTDPDAIRTLIGIGEVPEPEQTEMLISGGRIIYSPMSFNLMFEVDETNDTNYNLMLETQCNNKYKIWAEMSDGMLYGGNSGIELVFKGTQPLPKTAEETVKILFKGKWKSAKSPLRTLSPMF